MPHLKQWIEQLDRLSARKERCEQYTQNKTNRHLQNTSPNKSRIYICLIAYGIFYRIDHWSGHETSYNKFKMTESGVPTVAQW